MPALQAHNIHYQFDNGETLFRDISCSLSKRRVGLVGRNGIGKSILTSLLSKQLEPTRGSVSVNVSLATYSQLPSTLRESELTIAQYLRVDSVFSALEKIESGDCDDKWFNTVNEQWDVRQKVSEQLTELGLPDDVDMPCHQLSGGQLATLQLWQLFESDHELLILDEPSNHLDTKAKQWLITQCKQYQGHILLVSHDRQLLNEMEQIWELSTLGLHQFGGNYDFYAQQKSLEFQAIERQLKSAQSQQKQHESQIQKNKEKADQRCAKGDNIRKQGSQPKILLDAMRDSATKSVSNRLKNEIGKTEHLQRRINSLQSKQEQLKTQRMYLPSSDVSGKRLINIIQGKLPFGTATPFDLQIESGSKLHLKGDNGSGKSTLLKVLLGDARLSSGELNIGTSMYYLDQHFSILKEQASVLDNILTHCQGVYETDARIILAGIGFRKDSVHRAVRYLSGGEKMKLSMLIVGHQPDKPLLLLDEPDNHLDISSKRILAETLKHHQGAFILVSHDAYFVDDAGITHEYQLK